MKKLILFPLFLLGCESTPLNIPESQTTEVQAFDCYDTDYFGDKSFSYKVDSTESAASRIKTDLMARDLFSATFCESGISSIYEKRANKVAEVYRFFYHPSPRSPIIVEFDFTNNNAFSARSWDDKFVVKKKPDGTNYAASSIYEVWEPKFGHLSNDQADDIRMVFDANIICEPNEPRDLGGDATARIFERLSNGKYCALIDWVRATGTRSKTILETVGLSEFYVGE